MYSLNKMVRHNNHLELTWRNILQNVCVIPEVELQLPMSYLGFQRRQATQVNVISPKHILMGITLMDVHEMATIQ